MKIKHLILLCLIMVLGTGCAVYGTPKPPAAPTLPQSWLAAPQNGGNPTPGQWWTGFNDPALNRLMDRALKNAPDRRLAVARIREAAASARAATAQLGPAVNGTARGARNRNNPQNINNFSNFGFDASWEIDLFGRNAQTANAARATRDALVADERAITLSLLAEVARQYVLYRQFTLQAENARDIVAAHDTIVTMTRARVVQGLDSHIELTRAQNALNNAAAQIPVFDNLAQTAALQIDMLLGDMPGANAATLRGGKNTAIPELNNAIIVNTPARVIAMRPDIDAAMRRAIAATSLKKATFAAALPNLSLSAFLGWSAGDRIYQLNGNVLTPLFQFGRIRAEINASRAREEQAVIAFERAVLDALRDIETSLDAYNRMTDRARILDDAAAQARVTRTLVRAQRDEGVASGLDALLADIAELTARDAQLRGQSDQTLATVALCKSLALQPDTP